jgi:hypothetical protein
MFGYDTGGALTYANIEQRSLDLLTYAARSVAGAARADADRASAGAAVREVQSGCADQDGPLTRYQAYEIALRNRWKTVNEVRELEDHAAGQLGRRAELHDLHRAAVSALTRRRSRSTDRPREGSDDGQEQARDADRSTVRRAYPVQLEVRAQAGAPARCRGLRLGDREAYEMWDWLGEYGEVVRAGAFSKTLGENPAVQLLLNHDGLPMAHQRRHAAPDEDSTGLHMEAEVNTRAPMVNDVTALQAATSTRCRSRSG